MSNHHSTSLRPRARRLAWLAVAALTGMLAMASSTAAAGASDDDRNAPAQPPGEVSWHHTVGVQEIRYPNGETLTRRVEAWITSDGRYRVKTTSQDGTQTSEEVAYDGHGTQLILYTDPAGRQQALSIENDTHFAVTGSAGATNRQLRDSMRTASNSGYMTYEAGAVNQGSGSASSLNIAVPAGVEIKDLDDVTSPLKEPSSASVTHAAGSNSEIMRDFLGRPCLRAYNYRDSSTDFFTANSHIRGTCTLVAVGIWGTYMGNSGGLSPPRCGYPFIEHVPDIAIGYLPTYVSWSGYFPVNPNDRACSAHAGWDSDYTLLVNYRGLPASVWG